MAQRIPYYDELLEAYGQPGCPMCRVLDDAAGRLVEAVLFEMVNDVRVREELNAARGYCRRHGELLVRPGGALGSATMMQGVIKSVLRALDGQPEPGGSFGLRGMFRTKDPNAEGLVSRLSPQRPCPICANEAELLGHYTTTLLKYMTPAGPLASAYERSDGLCLPHFRHVAGQARGATPETLAGCQRVVWERLNAELEEFLRKSDYRFSHEPMGVERDSWRRAIAALSGPLPEHLTRS